MAGPISPHYILSTLPIGIIIRYPGKFVLHFWACFIEVTDTMRNIIDKLFPFKNRNCQQDWLALYDGPGLNSTQIGKYCGSTFPATSSSGRWLTLEFVTNTYTSGAGFKLNYNFTTSLIRMYNCAGPLLSLHVRYA